MSMPDLWSPAALAPKPRAAVRQIAIVPRERIYPAKKKLPRPTAIQNLAAQRERERQEAAAAAWHEGFRAAEIKYTIGIEYEATNYGLTFAPTMAAIIAEVARQHGLKAADIKGPRRHRAFVRARHEAMYRCYHETQNSLPVIGRALGNRDHTTVLYGIRKHAGTIQSMPLQKDT